MGKKKNRNTVLLAYLDAVTKNETLKDVCERLGKKPYQIFNGNPRYKLDRIDNVLYKQTPKYLDKHTDIDKRIRLSSFQNELSGKDEIN